MRSARRLFGLLLTCASATSPGAQENRSWAVDVELEGPLEAITLDCGDDGHTRLLAGLVRGEKRSVVVPVPRRVPLGLEGLAAAPLPELFAAGPGPARVLGWAAEQPDERVRLLVRLLARPRPTPEPFSGGSTAGLGSLGLALAFFVLASALRRRPAAALGAGLLGATVLLGLAGFQSGGQRAPVEVLLHEAEVGLPYALAVRGTRDEQRLGAGRLEVRPAGRALVFELELRDGSVGGRVRAPGAELFGIERGADVALRPERNDFVPLERLWLRSAGGTWEERGAWPLAVPLPTTGPGPGEREGAPPGWLSAGLPPGRSVLLGRTATAWVRLLGFPERD